MMQKTDPLITAQNISVRRNGKQILDDVSLTINERDFITLVGPNGAGKTMLIKAMLGLYTPDSGIINRRANVRLGYVPEKISGDASIPLNVEEFLRLRTDLSTTQMHELTKLTETTGLMPKRLNILSGGEWQRVLLARALAQQPDILILDEPAQNLDMGGQLRFYKLLEEIYETHKIAILLVSHDLHLVMASTKHVVCLFHHICCSGAPQAITRDPEFRAIFGDDMAQMLAVYPHNHNHTHDH